MRIVDLLGLKVYSFTYSLKKWRNPLHNRSKFSLVKFELLGAGSGRWSAMKQISLQDIFFDSPETKFAAGDFLTVHNEKPTLNQR